MEQPSVARRRQLLAVFVLSGFAGLIYQSVWSHYLGIFLGHAAYAQALVLAIFMGGMAAGAAWVAHAGGRWRNLIRRYAAIEAVIGVLGLAFHGLFTAVVGWSYDWLIPVVGAPWAVNLARWILAALLILPQTLLLGMTFPLMSGGLMRRYPGQDGNLLGGLYFTNSIGAALGALAAVFVLLPWVGLTGSMVAAGSLNLLVAGLSWWLARESEPELAAPNEGRVQAAGTLQSSYFLRAVLLATAVSGAASFTYEIVWIRMLGMAVGSTMHAFELMLASFIAGIALGGLWVRRRADATNNPLQLVGWMQVCMGLAALVSLVIYANAFDWVGWLMASLARTEGGYALFNLGTAAIAILIMLPAAFFAGTTLPLFTVALLRDGHGERAIGRVYAWNTLGSIAGVFAAIHLLIPLLGLKLALCIAAFVDILIGLFLLRWQASSSHAMLRLGAAAVVAALALVLSVTKVPFDPVKLASGVFRHGESTIGKGSRVAYYQDGKTASVSVLVSDDSGVASIATNGKIDAGIQMSDALPPSGDEATMALLAALPLSMHTKPEFIGVIGFGSGMTTHFLLGDSRVRRVDTIEIEPVMVQGARSFGRRVERAFNDRRSNVVVDDAKSYFAGQQLTYDVIISEPSNPWISGVGSLFSKEFYQFVPRHLKDGGLFVQWVQLYEIDDRLLSSILKALTPAFEDYSAWIAGPSDLVIVASPKGKLPATLNVADVLRGAVGSDLRRIDFGHPAKFDFHKVADARVLRAASHMYEVPVNSDFYPILGLEAPKTRFKMDRASMILDLPDEAILLLEALGIRFPLSEDIEISAGEHYSPANLTREARKIAAYLRGKALPALPDDVLITASYLRSTAAQTCEDGYSMSEAHVDRLAKQITHLALRTITFLPAQDLQGVWVNPGWLPCRSKWPQELKDLMSLLAAMSERNWQEMETQGRQWLEAKKSSGSRHVNELALSAVLLSLAQRGHWEQLIAAEKELGQGFPSTAGHELIRKLLVSMSHSELGK